MNREKTIKDRDAYLAKLKLNLAERFPNALDFYEKPENYTPAEVPSNWKQGKNSRKGLGKSKSLLTDSQLFHLLRRTRFGISQANYNAFKDLDVSEIVNLLLAEEELAPPVNDYSIDDPDVPFGETYINADYNGDFEGDRTVSNKTWFIEEMRKDSTSMHSTMWLFWHNHIPVELWAIFNGNFTYNYLKILHDHSYGNFKEMMYAITIDPAMLIYLNGFVNNKDAPDENYGREVQELFCIGKGPDANYTESDVQAAARLLTGWTINWDQQESYFEPWYHATEDKQFSEFYGNTLIEGKTGENGAEELEEFIDMIFENNEVAPFIVRKLYTFFVYSTIDDWTEENIIKPLAQIFRDNDYTIKPVLEALFNSDHFYDEVNYGAIIRTPADTMLGWWKTMDIQYPFDAETDIHNKRQVNLSMMWSMSEWGMEMGDPPNVAGWPAFYQFPSFDKTWVTTSTIVRRIAMVNNFLYWGFWSPNYVVTFDIVEYAKTIPDIADPNILVEHLVKFHLGMDIEQSTKDALKATLLTGQTEDYYWTNAWNSFIADEENEENMNIVRIRLLLLFNRFFQLAEYQLK